MDTFDETLLLEYPRNHIALLKLNRPASLNALTMDMVYNLHGVLDRIKAESNIRIVIITGVGRAFCAGMDIKSGSDNISDDKHVIAAKIEIQSAFSGIITRIRGLDQPVIAAVNGAAAGAGMAISLAADIRLGTPTTKFLIAAIKLGLTSGECGISYHLPRLISAAKAFEIMLTGRPVLAEEAERIGLVSRIVAPENLESEAILLAESILQNSPYAVTQTKKLMWQNIDANSLDAAISLENQTQIVASLTEDFAEATLAFKEKRQPIFSGN